MALFILFGNCPGAKLQKVEPGMVEFVVAPDFEATGKMGSFLQIAKFVPASTIGVGTTSIFIESTFTQLFRPVDGAGKL
jgi:hypothetical protein